MHGGRTTELSTFPAAVYQPERCVLKRGWSSDRYTLELALSVSLMVDKLECELKLGSSYTKVAAEIRAEVRSGRASVIPFNKSKYYAAVVDLREVTEQDALLHIQSRFGNHSDKIELLNTGEKKWDAMMTTIASVYDGNPEDLPTRRVDLCCDLPDVSVERIARTVRANFKRMEWQFGTITAQESDGKTVDFMQVSASKLTGIQLGSRPNPVRVYDKTAETKFRYEQAKRRADREAAAFLANNVQGIGEVPTDNTDVNRGFRKRLKAAACRMYPFPSFEDWSGLWEWQVLTRVERQMQGKIPLVVSTVRALRDNATLFNPFENLRFAAPGAELGVSEDDYSGFDWFVGLKMWEALQSGELTYQQMHKLFNRGRHGRRSGNANRIFDKFAPFVRRGSIGSDGAIDISPVELFERYRESVTRQLAA